MALSNQRTSVNASHTAPGLPSLSEVAKAVNANRNSTTIMTIVCTALGEVQYESIHIRNWNTALTIVGKKCGLDASEDGVEHHSYWQQEASCSGRDARQRACNCRTTSKEHGCHEDVGQQAKSDEDSMSGAAVASANCFEELTCQSSTPLAPYATPTVCAFGALRFNSMASVAKRRICAVAPLAYQNGPETPY